MENITLTNVSVTGPLVSTNAVEIDFLTTFITAILECSNKGWAFVFPEQKAFRSSANQRFIEVMIANTIIFK